MSAALGRRGALALLSSALAAACVPAGRPRHASTAVLRVFVSGAFAHALHRLAPLYERRTGTRVLIEQGPSMGETAKAIPQRLRRHEQADLVIMAREALDRLAGEGLVAPGSQTDLVRSRIAMAVRAGAPVPDISSLAALKQTLLAASSIAYSDSASGVHLSSKLFPAMGIGDAIAAKARMIPATPVGEIVARGEAEIGFQQLSELKPVPGIHIVGLLPEQAQKVTLFSAGIVSYSPAAGDARRLVDFLVSREAWPVMVAGGLEPAARPCVQQCGPGGR